MHEINNLKFWRFLTNFWSVVALFIFTAAFLYPGYLNSILSSIGIIYGSVLAIYVGSKEISRWRNKTFISRYSGEIFIGLWTVMMLFFLLASALNQGYDLPSEFTATYITVLGVFAISQKSKILKEK